MIERNEKLCPPPPKLFKVFLQQPFTSNTQPVAGGTPLIVTGFDCCINSCEVPGPPALQLFFEVTDFQNYYFTFGCLKATT